MHLKIRCDREIWKILQNFLELNKAVVVWGESFPSLILCIYTSVINEINIEFITFAPYNYLKQATTLGTNAC